MYLTCDMVLAHDSSAALGCATGYAAKGDFENMVTYSTAQGYKPDYMYLMQRMMMDNPEAAVCTRT